MRARYPDEEGYVERDGVRTFYEVYGEGEPTLLFLPTWSIVHSRCWKGQIPYFARHARVVTFDPRGNGRSDRPLEQAAYDEAEYAADALAVLDATETDRAVVVALSRGCQRAALLAAEHPERVAAICFLAPKIRAGDMSAFEQPLDEYEGWAMHNRHYWEKNLAGYLEFFWAEVFCEPHSTKQIDDAIGWGLEATPPALIASALGKGIGDESDELYSRLDCPVLVMRGTRDPLVPAEMAQDLVDATGGRLVHLEGSGHNPQARHPVRFNIELREFVTSLERRPEVAASASR